MSTYVPAASLSDFLQHLDQAIAWCKAMQVQRVFLEVYRGGVTVAADDLCSARDRLRAAGLKASAGLTTTWGPGCGAPGVPTPQRFCMSSPATAAQLDRCVRLAAGLFDELILDDFFFTDCRCARCNAARGTRSWSEFRMDQLFEASTRIMRAARQTNSACRVIIKYPQWYDRFCIRGYDILRQTQVFDAIWVGTETRDPRPGKGYNYIKETQSWITYNCLYDIAKEKTWGAWFDPYGCDEPSYIEQAFQSVLVSAPEITLFCYSSLQTPEAQPLAMALQQQLPRLRRWAASLHGLQPAGIACYRPAHASPLLEPYLLDYLPMIGLPVTVHATFPAEAPCIFCGEASLGDSDVASRLRDYVHSGGRVIATAAFVHGLPADVAEEVFGLAACGEAGLRATLCLRWQKEPFPLSVPLVLTGTLRPTRASVIASADGDDGPIPWLTWCSCGAGQAMLLDVCSGWVEPEAMNVKWEPPMLFLPPVVLDRLRQTVLAGLGFSMRGPASVGLYCFPPEALAVLNYRDEPVEIELRLHGQTSFASLATMTPQAGDAPALIEQSENSIRFSLSARQGTLLRRQ